MFWPESQDRAHRCSIRASATMHSVNFVRTGGDRYKMTAAKLRLAMASMGKTADHGRQPMP